MSLERFLPSKIKIAESCNATPYEDQPRFLRCTHRIRMSKESRIQTITGIITLTFEPEDGLALSSRNNQLNFSSKKIATNLFFSANFTSDKPKFPFNPSLERLS